MKKIICTLLAMIMVAMCFAACSTSTSKTSYDDLAIACELTSEEYGIGFRKGSDLVKEVDTIINSLIEDGTLSELAEKYDLTLAEDPKANDTYASTVKDVDYVKGNGKLVIGITDYAPMNYKDTEGE